METIDSGDGYIQKESNASMLSFGMADSMFDIFNGIFGAFYFIFL